MNIKHIPNRLGTSVVSALVFWVACFSDPNPEVGDAGGSRGDAATSSGGTVSGVEVAGTGGSGGRQGDAADSAAMPADAPADYRFEDGAGGSIDVRVSTGGSGGYPAGDGSVDVNLAAGGVGAGGTTMIGGSSGTGGATGTGGRGTGGISASGGNGSGGVIATGGGATGGSGSGGSGTGGSGSGGSGSGGSGSGGSGSGGSGSGGSGSGGSGSGGSGTGGSPCPSPAACTIGVGYCSGSTLQSCSANTSGCPTLTTNRVCGSDTPVCNATAQRCDCDSTAAATCNGVNARLVCSTSTGQWENVACGATKPACVGGTCVLCTEHSQCPGGACHLSGAKAGTCFASTSVLRATSLDALQTAISGLASPGELAVILPAGSYITTNQVQVMANQEVAIVGESGQPRWGGNGTWSDPRNPMINVASSGTLYFANIRLEDATPNSTGITSTSGAIVWVDDAFISGYYTAITSAGDELHVRRSLLRGGSVAGLYIYAGTLFMENTAIAPLLSAPESGMGGIMTYSASIVFDIRYSTIIGGQLAIQCQGGPQPSGAIRNSLLLSYSTTASPIPSTCSTVNQSGNFAPTISYTPSWFVGAASGNFHLSTGGKAAVTQTAQWGAGDPTVDIDGDPRPQSGAGYPGVDQP